MMEAYELAKQQGLKKMVRPSKAGAYSIGKLLTKPAQHFFACPGSLWMIIFDKA
jgi:hypothetical protein